MRCPKHQQPSLLPFPSETGAPLLSQCLLYSILTHRSRRLLIISSTCPLSLLLVLPVQGSSDIQLLPLRFITLQPQLVHPSSAESQS